jgi:hypothetical protein
MSATAMTMTAPATIVLGVIGSSSTRAPRITATIGFTYAYVATFDSGATRRARRTCEGQQAARP